MASTRTGYILSPEEARDYAAMRRLFMRKNTSGAVPKGRKAAAVPPNIMVVCRATSVISGQGGRYNGKLISWGVNSAKGTSQIKATDLGELSDAEDLILWSVSEIGGTGHLIDVASTSPPPVFVGYFLAWDDDSGKPIILLPAENSLCCIVKVTGNDTCGGVYTCRKYKRPAADITAMSSSTFSMADLGTDPGTDDGHLFHLPEAGKTTHDLTDTDNTGNAKLVLSLLWHTNSNGQNIYLGIQVYPGCT